MNRITKLLSVFFIAGALGTGIAGVAGCSKGDDKTEHNHEDHLVWAQTEDGKQHYQKCTEDDYTTTPADHDFSGIVCECGVEHDHDLKLTDTNNGYHRPVCTGCPQESGKYNLHSWGSDDKCTKCGTDRYVEVEFEMNVTDNFEVGKSDEARRYGIYTVGANTEVRTRTKELVYENVKGGAKVSDALYERSIKIGGNSDKIIIDAPARGKLIIHAQNGSNGVEGMRKLSFGGPLGGTQILVCADDGSPTREVEIDIPKEGQYTIGRVEGTMDIYYAKFVCTVENTPTESVEIVDTGSNEFYVGQKFAPNGLAVNKTTQSGAVSPVDVLKDKVTIDSSAVDMTKEGVYPVKVTYNDGVNDFETSYDVTVYSVQSLSVGKDAIIKGENSAAGNGVYEHHHLREMYFAGDKLSTDGMTVIVNASIGDGAAKKTRTFIVKDGYTLSGDDLSGKGKKTVTVSLDGSTVSQTFDVYVMDKVNLSAATTPVSVAVDGNLADAEVGTVKEEAYQFKTIHQALEFLENCGVPANVKKTITLAAGVYKEKLDVKVPNLTIVGAGADTDTEGAVYSMIEWDSLYGIADESGFVHTTDSTSTLQILDSATGFTIKNTVISNWYNCTEHFNEKFGTGYSEHRALAMLIRADKVTVDGCTLLGYQDTLELFTGRHIFKNCLIVGVTDFIFGTNGTTYFKQCEIRAIKHASGGVGYYTAFKGNNKGSSTDKITYGAIFDDCDFTAEEGVASGWALGRAWGADAAVMVMNSRLGKHISKTSSRYIAMGNGEPQNAQFTEYGNTALAEGDDGTLATPVKVSGKNLWNVPTAENAAKYSDFSVIFGKTNGMITYEDVWEVTVDDE